MVSEELKAIKDNIINRIITIAVLLIIPSYLVSINRIQDIGIQSIFYVHTLFLLIFLILFIFRKKFVFRFKIHSLSIVFLAIGTTGLLAYGFAGGFYFCFIPLIINSILLGKKTAVYYLIIIAILYSAIATLLSLQILKTQVNLNKYLLYPSSWVTFFTGVIYVAIVIVVVASELFNYFVRTIEQKNIATSELTKNENRLQRILDNIPALIFMKDDKGVYKFINQNFREVFNVKIPVKGKTDYDLFEREFAEKFRTDDKRIINSFIPETIEETFIHENKIYTYFTKKVAIKTSENDIELLGTSIDISQKKIAELALEKSEKRLRNAQKIGKIGHWYLDIVKNKLEWSDEVYRIFNLEPQQFDATYDGFLDKIHPEDREAVNHAYSNSLVTKIPYEIIHRLKLKNNTIKYVKEKCDTEFDKDGKPLRSLGTIQDITDLIIAENALKESEYRLKEAESLAHVGHYFYIINEDKLEWSEEVYKIFETSPEETSANYGTFLDFIHPDDRSMLTEAFSKSLREKKIISLEHRLLLKNGEIKYVNEKIRTEYNSRGQPEYSIGVILDITQLKKTQLELIKHRDNLEETVTKRTKELKTTNEELQTINEELQTINEELYFKNEEISSQKKELEKTLQQLKKAQNQLIQTEKMASLGILTAGVAHEINNPLNFIYAAYYGLEIFFKNKTIDEKKEVAPLLNGIKVGVERAVDIIKGLNQFSRNNKSPEENCDIHQIIDNCLVMLQNQTKNKIQIKKHYCKIPCELKGNIGKLHQVILNLLLNAIQSIRNKGIISISTFAESSKLTIKVTDNGCGISEKNLVKIIDPFFTTKEPGHGTGLGLSISYNIIKEHNGNLEFKSKEGEGTTAIITLPLNKKNHE